MKAKDVSAALLSHASPQKAKASSWFFKTGLGQYGEGDKFLGVTLPEQRAIAKQFKDLPLEEVEKLVMSPWHEERLTSLIILVNRYKKADESQQKIIYGFYLSNTKYVNNWDLVDLSAGYIVGSHLRGKPEKMKVLTKLARSDWLWDRRIAMIATFDFIVQGSAEEALEIAETLLHDDHDLIQKAVGWMLREVGKRVGKKPLMDFLDKYAATMPRTTLRYAIEHFVPQQRAHYMSLAKALK